MSSIQLGAPPLGWAASLLGPAATLVAAFGGAWLAFRLERQQRERDKIDRHVGAANRALFTLFNFWNILDEYRRDVIEPYRGQPDAWLNMPGSFPSDYGLTRFETSDLSFLLDTREADEFAVLMVEEQRFHIAIKLVEERSSLLLTQAHIRFAAAGIAPGMPIPGGDPSRILGIDVTTKLQALSAGITKNVDEDLQSICDTHDRLRAAMARLYPKRNVVCIGFGDGATHADKSMT